MFVSHVRPGDILIYKIMMQQEEVRIWELRAAKIRQNIERQGAAYMHMYHGISCVAASMCFGIPCVLTRGAKSLLHTLVPITGCCNTIYACTPRIHK